MSKVPNILLNNGKSMPILGLGTWGSPPGVVAQAIKDAIDAGYRHFDCAHVYQNEDEVGEGINMKIAEGVVKREEIFVVSKIWNTFHRPALVRSAFDATLKNLNLSYIDLYLIHWPMAYKEGEKLIPKDENGKIIPANIDYLDTWKEMEKLVDEGLVKSIGISNFNKAQVERVLANCRIKPVVNQIECNPYLTQQKLSSFLKSKDIAVTAYSPLGSPSRPWSLPTDPILLEEPKLKAIAEKYNKSIGQILIKYQIQRGHIVIPKSSTKSRIISNFNIFDFNLSDEDVKEIENFECNGRVCTVTGAIGHPYYPFDDEF